MIRIQGEKLYRWYKYIDISILYNTYLSFFLLNFYFQMSSDFGSTEISW